jgi:DNA-binding response OmpR family regulator
MLKGHRVLIVEDHSATADDLARIFRSHDCTCEIAVTKSAALEYLERELPCVVLLDLEICRTPDELKGHSANGIALLDEIRSRFGGPPGATFWIPVMIVSGHANEPDDVAELMKLEADDVIQKPYKRDDLVRRVRDALLKSGRTNHDACTKVNVQRRVDGILVSISGAVHGRRRLEVEINGKRAGLTESSMCVFLRLLIAHATGKTVHLTDFGKRIDGRKHVGRLRTDLLAVMNDPTAFVVNAYGGKYSLRADVQIGDCDIGRLATITELARELAAVLPEAKSRLKE